MTSRRAIPFALVGLCAVLLAEPASAEPVRVRAVQAELVSEVGSILPGRPFWVGLRLVMDPHWHTYWSNPGDSGLPTTVRWKLREGFVAGDLQWPYPQRFEHPPYVSFGYEGEVLLISELRPPANLQVGGEASLGARVDWTVCQADLCVPGGVNLTLSLPVTESEPAIDEAWKSRFEATRERLPRTISHWQTQARVVGGILELSLTPDDEIEPGEILVFESVRDSVDHERPILRTTEGGTVRLQIPLQSRLRAPPDRFEAVLVAGRHWDGAGTVKALFVSVPLNSP